MLKLNEYEKIDSWDIVVKTTDGRVFYCIKNLGLDLPGTVTDRVDQLLKEFYSCAWVDPD